MDHEQAALLIPDLAGERLDRAQASEVERHLAGCADCRDALALHRRFRGQIESSGECLFTDHPSTDLLVDLALDPARVAGSERARLDAHVQACPTCRVEVASIRGADARARSWWQGAADALRWGALPGPIPALVPALMVLIFVYPAYLGVVRLPEVRREREKALGEVAALRDSAQVGGGSWTGGPVALLSLPSEARGDDDTIPPPAVRLRPGQTFQPVRIDFDPSLWPADQVVVVTLRARDSQEVLWSHHANVGTLWDAADEAINLLLPVQRLKPGEFVVEIRGAESAPPTYSARFRIEG